MVERFIARISEIVSQIRFGSAAALESTLRNHLNIYNHSISRRALHHQTPIQALKKWQQDKPDLFAKRTYIRMGLDTRFGLREAIFRHRPLNTRTQQTLGW